MTHYLRYIVLHLCNTQKPGEYRINCISLLILSISPKAEALRLQTANNEFEICLDLIQGFFKIYHHIEIVFKIKIRNYLSKNEAHKLCHTVSMVVRRSEGFF